MAGKNGVPMEDIERELGLKERVEFKKPDMYKVLIFNDDYTTKDFVVEVLMGVFNKPAAEATIIMMDVHRKGAGVCGVYTLDIAQSKVNQVHKKAEEAGFPLRCGVEKA